MNDGEELRSSCNSRDVTLTCPVPPKNPVYLAETGLAAPCFKEYLLLRFAGFPLPGPRPLDLPPTVVPTSMLVFPALPFSSWRPEVAVPWQGRFGSSAPVSARRPTTDLRGVHGELDAFHRSLHPRSSPHRRPR